ncbi:uncharacterized protein DNG_04884 [Cephalotrichum gorgonifer]|uniref:Uncharacterized protein n=1 Tax=Cephalotrichum gorgonifer TaxID=2041049 RepID=A0AAE8MWV9_9PEZI|nr:uncharacterized protein DNG_04884 [Cephalotrichum gorgonifer]
MSRILRPAHGLTRAEFYRAKETVRSFTTSQFFAAENDNSSSRPTFAAGNDNTSSSSSRPTFAQRSERTSRDVNSILSQSPSRGAAGALGGAPRGKVLNLQSLPRRARGGGLGGAEGFRGRGAFRGAGVEGLRGRGSLRGAGTQGFRGRGSFRGAEGARGGRGGRGRGRGGAKRSGGDGAAKDEDLSARRRQGPKEPETLEERQARLAREVGYATKYKPTTDIGTLGPYLPEVATDSNPLGRLAAATTSMRLIARGYVDPNPVINAEDMYRRFRADGAAFFTDLSAREALATQGEVGMPEEAVKEAVLKSAVLGEYAAVEATTYEDVVGTARNALRKEGTYQGQQVDKFEAKLAQLVAKAKARQAKPKVKEQAAPEPVKARGKGKGKARVKA